MAIKPPNNPKMRLKRIIEYEYSFGKKIIFNAGRPNT